MTEIHVSWAEYHQKIETLAALIYRSNWQFDQVLCLARGGLRVGDILSRIYDKPLAILSAASYGGDRDRVRGELTFSRNISMTTPTLAERILIADDLVESGVTLAKTLDWLRQSDIHAIKQVKTAVIWYKSASIIQPDFYVDYLPDNPWVKQPFETYERMSLTDLALPSQISVVIQESV